MDSFKVMQVAKGRVPNEGYWDKEDPRLLGIETDYAGDQNSETKPGERIEEIKDIDADDFKKKKKEDEFYGTSLETFFVTTEYGIKQ